MVANAVPAGESHQTQRTAQPQHVQMESTFYIHMELSTHFLVKL